MSQMVTELETARGHADILLCSVRWLQGHRLLEGILVPFSAYRHTDPSAMIINFVTNSIYKQFLFLLQCLKNSPASFS